MRCTGSFVQFLVHLFATLFIPERRVFVKRRASFKWLNTDRVVTRISQLVAVCRKLYRTVIVNSEP